MPRRKESRIDKIDIQARNERSYRPADGLRHSAIDKRPHLLAITCKLYERDDCKRELRRQHHLTEDQQLTRAARAIPI